VSGPPAVGITLTPRLALPEAGERVDMFALEAPIGVGGMGAVFRALDTRLDRHVALKILPPEQAHDPEVVLRFYQEGRAAARLDHENIARVFTIGHDGRYHFIAFEYIEGATVRQRVERNGPLPLSEAINFTLQIADALVHASERGVVHRDIKPSNIIVTPQGRAKLVDMGLARRFERGGDDGLTQSGMTLGTFDYISPEQARDPRDVDVRSDLYSLGCTLFHMLTGRPPFPEGTVLQKLIQHQEEPPPDVRELNPSVTPDLASILVKLMAKDRDRRYQTPEQLVRDLLTVAGALGLRSLSPEGLVWLASTPPMTWERHLVWGVPSLAFALVVGGLVWWGQDPGRPSAPISPAADGLSKVTLGAPVTPLKTGPPASSAAESPSVAETGSDEPVPGETPPPTPRDIDVEPGDDLLAAIARAAPRSVILLTGNGPYELEFGRDDREVVGRLVGRDLTIRADAGARPVLRLTRLNASGAKVRPALLDFTGGHVTLEDLEFQVDPGDGSQPLSAVRTEDTELTARRCVFRRSGDPTGSGTAPVSAVHTRVSKATGTGAERPPAVVLQDCHFEGAQAGVRVDGPADVRLVDCTFAGSDPAVWLDNARAPAPVPAELRLKHVSVAAGAGAVFRFEGTDARVWVDDSVVAPAGSREVTLVSTDRPDALVWRGRGNLYAHVDTYLAPLAGQTSRESIRDVSLWRQDEVRESGTEVASGVVWEQPDLMKMLALEIQNPTRAFRLATIHPGLREVGARRGPFGTLAPGLRVAANPLPPPTADVSAPGGKRNVVPNGEDKRQKEGVTPLPPPPTTQQPPSTKVRVEPDAVAISTAPADLPEMPVMPPQAGSGREKEKDSSDHGDAPPEASQAPTPGGVATGGATTVANASDAAPLDHGVLRTADQFVNALVATRGRGGLFRVSADARWDLSATVIRATGAVRVQAEPGTTRPRLRFVPAPVDPKAAAGRVSMIELKSGSLQLEGLDVVLPRENAPRQGRWAAFAVGPATDLNFIGCTVTVEGDDVLSAVIAADEVEREAEGAANAPESGAATVRATDCLFRSGGDMLDVVAERRLVLELDNAVVATGGSMVHVHGIPRGQTPEPCRITLRQVTDRSAGGFLHMESAPAEPELPVAHINARYSIFATSVPNDAALVRVDGQDAPASMRNRIVWEGLGVAYHELSTYRRDQSAQVGAEPTLYDRPSWVVAVGASEQAAVHGDLKFRRNWDPKRPVWTLDRDDVRLGKDSPAADAGPKLDRIPNPPPNPT